MNIVNLYDILSNVESSESITDISHKLYLNQPYISKQLNKAERYYNTKLINRRPLPISLTETGKIVLNSLEKQLNIQNQLKSDLSNYLNSNQFIKIATNQPWITFYGDIIYKHLHHKFSDYHFELTEVTSDLAEQKLLTKEIDIFGGKMLNNPSLKSTFTFDNHFYFLIPATSSLYSSTNYVRVLSRNDLNQFNNQNFVSLTDDSFFQKLVDHMFIDNNIKQNKVLKVSNHMTGTNAAAKGAGIFVTSYDFVEKWIGKEKFNLISIPETLFNFKMAITTRNDAGLKIKAIAKEMIKLEKVYGYFLRTET